MSMLRRVLFLSFLLIVPFSHGQKDNQGSGDTQFEILKNMEIMSSIFKTLDMMFVDEIDVGHLSKVAIDAMLEELDPYTVYIPETNMEDFRFMTTGQYGGIGALIRKRDDRVMISEPYEGFGAFKAGLMAGDLIMEIDGKDVKGLDTKEVSTMLKGTQGTTVNVKVKRGEEILDKQITREEVKIDAVNYYGMLSDDVGYISLRSFTRTASAEVITAFEELKGKGMKKLVLDLRGNGGGLLIEAVKIANIFIPKDKLVVTTKGRIQRMNKTYMTESAPLDLNIPVAILVDGGTASASEIVSGTLQDYDRGVIIGRTSYGKGLVQQTPDLVYNSKLKLTIAKYYTPSGRCIQRIEYYTGEEGDKPEDVADSLVHKFKTTNGRDVIDARGIEPDVVVEKDRYSRLTGTLVANDLIFDYATEYRVDHPEIGPASDFTITDAMYDDFLAWLDKKDYSYTTASEEKMKELKKVVSKESYWKEAEEAYEALLKKVQPSKQRDLEKFKDEVIEILANEIVSRYHYQKGRVEQSMPADEDIKEAIKVLDDQPRYNKILKPGV